MTENSEHVEAAVNPYESPESETQEKKARREKTQWRIVPTTLLAIISSMGLVAHFAMFGTDIFFLLDDISKPDADFVFWSILIHHLQFLACMVIWVGGDVVGVLAARNCWKGRWLRSSIQATVFLAILMLVYVYLSYYL